ncbi:glycosyltransferase family 39 protein [Lewinella sp. 4G2]|uniref:ArnT family glycosyltransferase n=1 Tax=Lewinella sp. 4G2 TaxID=1803372 RepID=UPI0007B487B8|nr:glycosyltransferase family 39 protein [Lewinella sp. 4G2]OAV44598.1 hypothetical protein A3850_008880 [Lewinella sp. 4G2]
MKLPAKSINPLYLLALWLVVCLVQAWGTPLDPDETYYWMYAGNIDWGYYDHPPAVALLVAIGKDWLPGPLGLRLGHVLVSALTMIGLWHLLERPFGKWLWVAAALAFAQPFLNVYGFIATPDGPLLLFTVVYLLAYRRFLDAPTVANGAIWGLTMAGALYSKYHGVMLIFFSVLPNLWWLLRRPGAWVAALGGAALYFPHLYWQYANDFPSFRYHLQGRDDPYQFKYTTEYLLNQLVIFSPFLLWFYVKTFWKDDSRKDRFLTANRWLVLGFLVFFLYTTSKGGTEAQWTALLSFPLVYLTYRAARDRFPEWAPKLWTLSLITIGILTLARLLLLAPREWLPFQKPFDHEPWTQQLAERANGQPVMFENTYRFSSLYEFYTGQPGWTMTNVDYRRNQYDLWYGDSIYHNQQVLVVGQKNWATEGAEPFRAFRGDMLIKTVDNFQVLKSIDLELAESPEVLPIGGEVPISLLAKLPKAAGLRSVDLSTAAAPRLFVTIYLPDGEKEFYPIGTLAVAAISVGEEVVLFRGSFRVLDKLPAGPATMEFGLAYPGMPPLRGMGPVYPVELRD